MFQILRIALAAAAAAVTFGAYGATVTVGSLSRDSAGNTIVDSLNNREWCFDFHPEPPRLATTAVAALASAAWPAFGAPLDRGRRLIHTSDTCAGGNPACDLSRYRDHALRG